MSYDISKDSDDDFRMGYERGIWEMKNKAIDAFCSQLYKDSHYCELSKTANYSCRKSCPLYREFLKQLDKKSERD